MTNALSSDTPSSRARCAPFRSLVLALTAIQIVALVIADAWHPSVILIAGLIIGLVGSLIAILPPRTARFISWRDGLVGAALCITTIACGLISAQIAASLTLLLVVTGVAVVCGVLVWLTSPRTVARRSTRGLYHDATTQAPAELTIMRLAAGMLVLQSIHLPGALV